MLVLKGAIYALFYMTCHVQFIIGLPDISNTWHGCIHTHICYVTYLTHKRWEIQPYLTRSKWNMGEIFGLNFYLSYLHTKFFWNPSMCNQGHFCYWICNFVKKILLSLKLNWFRRKWLSHGRISKMFFLDHFSPSFLDQKS